MIRKLLVFLLVSSRSKNYKVKCKQSPTDVFCLRPGEPLLLFPLLKFSKATV